MAREGRNTYHELIARVGLDEARRIVREKAQAYRDAHKDEMNANLREQRKAKVPQRREIQRRYYENNRDTVRAYAREYYAKNRERILDRGKGYAEKNPEKRTARKLLLSAIKDGKIVRPDTCDVCKKVGPIEAHHHDYEKPFEVDWLCRSCHGKLHRLADGHERAPAKGNQTIESGVAVGSGKAPANVLIVVVEPEPEEEVEDPVVVAARLARRQALLQEPVDPELDNRRAWAEENREYLRQYSRDYYLANKEKIKAAQAKDYRENTAKWMARQTVKRAIKQGKLKRLDRCEWCTKGPVWTEAHHEDHAKPLQVTWVCRPCHRRWTKRERQVLEKERAAQAAKAGGASGAASPDSPG